VNDIVFFLFYKECVCAFLYYKGLKCTFGIKEFIGFKGMPLLLRVLLSSICDKFGFSRSSVLVILVLKENGEQL
jgi:hypothetical protein